MSNGLEFGGSPEENLMSPSPGVVQAIKNLLASKGHNMSGDPEVHIVSASELMGHGKGMTPMSAEEARKVWIESAWTPAPGDVVNVRPEFSCGIKHPDVGQNVVITRLIDPPLTSDSGGPHNTASRQDIALGFKIAGGGHDHYMEHTYDSRMFVKVGSIHDAD